MTCQIAKQEKTDQQKSCKWKTQKLHNPTDITLHISWMIGSSSQSLHQCQLHTFEQFDEFCQVSFATWPSAISLQVGLAFLCPTSHEGSIYYLHSSIVKPSVFYCNFDFEKKLLCVKVKDKERPPIQKSESDAGDFEQNLILQFAIVTQIVDFFYGTSRGKFIMNV